MVIADFLVVVWELSMTEPRAWRFSIDHLKSAINN